MKRAVCAGVLLVLLIFLLPLFWLRPEQTKSAAVPPPETEQATQSEPAITVLHEGQVQELSLEDYVWGVTAAEMPAAFPEEALKAQAVAARTYGLRKARAAVQAHPQAQLCGSFACCQAYCTRAEAYARWGAQAESYAEKIEKAVQETAGLVLCYDGELISAVFHSSSGGKTAAAVAVWGNSVPYLQSVDSPEGEEVPNYHSEVCCTPEEFRRKIQAIAPQAALEGEPARWLGEAARSPDGRVATWEIGGVAVGGRELRQEFALRSSAFSLCYAEGRFVFSVTGYGHGVGMSQYGARALAGQGKSWQDILRWYYTGVEIVPCSSLTS